MRNVACPAAYLIHVETLDQARSLVSPAAVVSAIPDFAPQTQNEKTVRDVLSYFRSTNPEKGALLEMCYHPSPDTQISRLTEQAGWQVIGGIEAMTGQGLTQASLWTGIELDASVRDTARDAVRARLSGQQIYNAE